MFCQLADPCLFLCTGWKAKSDDCEKVMNELKKKSTSATGSIGKLKRQINSKVRCQNDENLTIKK